VSISHNLNTIGVLQRTPAALYESLDRLFADPDWVSWDADTISLLLGGALDQLALDKVLAVQATARNLYEVTSEAMVFEKVVNAFNNLACIMDAPQPPFVQEIMYAVLQIEQIAKITQVSGQAEDFTYSCEVPGYVAAVAKYHSWVVLPKPLGFAQQILDYLNGTQCRRARDPNIDTLVKSLETLSEQLDTVESVTAESLNAFDTQKTEHRDAAQLIGCYLYRPNANS